MYWQESEHGSIKGRVESDSDSEDYGKDVVCTLYHLRLVKIKPSWGFQTRSDTNQAV